MIAITGSTGRYVAIARGETGPPTGDVEVLLGRPATSLTDLLRPGYGENVPAV